MPRSKVHLNPRLQAPNNTHSQPPQLRTDHCTDILLKFALQCWLLMLCYALHTMHFALLARTTRRAPTTAATGVC
jgi:hypothetical protein